MNNLMDNISKINKLDKEIKITTTRKEELERKINDKVYFVFFLIFLSIIPLGYYSIELFEYISPESTFGKASLASVLLFFTIFLPFSILLLFEYFNLFGEEESLKKKIKKELSALKKEKDLVIKELDTNEISKIENYFNKELFEQCIDIIEEDQEGMSIEKCAIEKLRLKISEETHDPKKREVVRFLEEYDKEVQRIKEIRKNDRLNKIKEKKNMHDLVND